MARPPLQVRFLGALDEDVIGVDRRDLDPTDRLAVLEGLREQVGELLGDSLDPPPPSPVTAGSWRNSSLTASSWSAASFWRTDA